MPCPIVCFCCQYADLTTRTSDWSDPDGVILWAEPLRPLAERYWHASANLRLCYLYYNLFVAYHKKVCPRPPTKPAAEVCRIRWAESGIRFGELSMTMIDRYRMIEHHEMQWSRIYYALAQFSHLIKDRNRVIHWLTELKKVCERNQEAMKVAQVEKTFGLYRKGEKWPSDLLKC